MFLRKQGNNYVLSSHKTLLLPFSKFMYQKDKDHEETTDIQQLFENLNSVTRQLMTSFFLCACDKVIL